MTYFIRSGNSYTISDKAALNISETLPAGNYVVKFNQMEGRFFLEGIEDFELPKKIYGASDNNRDRIIQSFLDRSGSTGVLLSGEKGSGKTLLTKSLSIELAKQGIPTLVINSPFAGDGFNKFIQTIEQPCVILFDEFEKVYDKDTQPQILTLLDGVFPTKKLFLLTINDGYIDPHMRNRPGRIYYQISYRGLDGDFIREYCEDNLNNKEQTEKLVMIAGCFGAFNFDMLKACVEEMNRFDEPASKVMKLINTRLEFDTSGLSFEVQVFFDGHTLLPGQFHPSSLRISPLALTLDNKPDLDMYSIPKLKDDKGDVVEHWDFSDYEFIFTDDKLLKIEKNGSIVYKFVGPEEKEILVRFNRRQALASFNFDAF